MAEIVQLQYPTYRNVESSQPFSEFDTIKIYLGDPGATAESTAVALTNHIREADTEGSLNVLNDEIADRLSDIWAAILGAAVQIPFDHAWQDRLVDLLDAIKTLPFPEHLEILQSLNSPSLLTWSHLPGLGMEVHSDLSSRGYINSPTNQDAIMLASAWINYNAFLAKTSSRGVFRVSAAEIMLDSLCLHANERTLNEVEEGIPGLSVWLIYAGDMVWKACQERWGHHAGNRWNNCKGALQQHVEDERFKSETRRWSEKALQAMYGI